MSALRRFVLRVRELLRGHSSEQDLDRELASHLALLEDGFVHRGQSPEVARRAARLALGGVEQIRELHRDARSFAWVRDAARDIRYSARALRRTPAFAATVIATLALGIGANTAIFSVVNTLLLRTLPVPHPEQLVTLRSQLGSSTFATWSQIRQLKDRFENVAAWSDTRFTLTDPGDAEVVQGLYISGSYFSTLGVAPHVGRLVTEADDRRGAPTGAVAVIGYGFWERRFGGEASAVGARITLEGVPFTIVGVTPPSFFGTEIGRAFDVAIPIGSEPLIRGRETALDNRAFGWLSVLLRLKAGTSIDAGTAVLRTLQQRIRTGAMPENWPEEFQRQFLPEPLSLDPASAGTSSLRSQYRQPLLTLLAVVTLLLVIACVNLASLFLARTSSRRHETSVRMALGAPRARILRQWFMESFMLSTAGSAIGLVFAAWGSRFLLALLSTSTRPVALDLSLNGSVLTFTAVMAVTTAVLFGTAPAIRAVRGEPGAGLKEGRAGGTADGSANYSTGLIVTHALSLLLVVASGLFVRTFASLSSVPLGFQPQGLIVVNVDTRRAGVQPRDRQAVFQDLVKRASAVPGVAAAAASVMTPIGGNGLIDVVNRHGEAPVTQLFEGPGRPSPRSALMNYVTPRWFSTYGMVLRLGRDIADDDTAASPAVVVVNESFVNTFFPGRNPIGARFSGLAPGEKTVIGVVSDAVYDSLRDEPKPTMYMPLAQFTMGGPSASAVSITIRAASGPPMQLVRSVTAALAAASPQLAMAVRPLADQVSASLLRERAMAILSGFFGSLALLLAAVGVYGVTSYGVARRQREFGIRMALGAQGADIIGLVILRHLRLIAAGMGLGLVGAALLTRYLQGLLFGVTPLDPVTFITVPLLLASVAAAAAFIPARRATRADPLVVLRAE